MHFHAWILNVHWKSLMNSAETLVNRCHHRSQIFSSFQIAAGIMFTVEKNTVHTVYHKESGGVYFLFNYHCIVII